MMCKTDYTVCHISIKISYYSIDYFVLIPFACMKIYSLSEFNLEENRYRLNLPNLASNIFFNTNYIVYKFKGLTHDVDDFFLLSNNKLLLCDIIIDN